MAHYTYKFRLYPNQEQQTLLAKHFGCCRFIYNYFLARRKGIYLISGSGSTFFKDSAELPNLKGYNEWLYEISAQSLQFELKCLDTAYKRFFAKTAQFPKFHNKNDKQSFTIMQNVKVEDNKLFITKFREGINIRLHRKIEGEICHATISRNRAGQYFAAILVERNIKPLETINQEVGIDLGITTLATCSTGKEYLNIRPYRNLQQKIRLLTKSLHRKKLGSKNREKARKKLAKLHNKIANIRNDHLHKVSRNIIDENQVICLEDLNISGMLKNHRLAKSVADVSLSELVRQIEYKANWHGRTVIKVSRWYASSKTCSNCNFKLDDLPLEIREWVCPRCNVKHHRDKNAAQNILCEGKRTVGTTGIAYGLDKG